MDEKRFYVYIWWNDDKEEVFYVGKGTKNRYKSRKTNRSQYFINTVNKYKCHPEIVVSNLTNDEALQAEVMVEKILRKNGCHLVNLTPCGGQPPLTPCGKDNPNFGHHWTEEMKQKASKLLKERGSHAGLRNGRCRKIRIVETGETFGSYQEFCKKYGFNSESCRTRVNKCGMYKGYHIEKCK